MLVKADPEAEAEVQRKWDSARDLHKPLLESFWKRHLREKEAASLGNSRMFLGSSMLLAFCVWMEKLGPELRLPADGAGANLEWYQGELTDILIKNLAARVETTLVEAHVKLEQLIQVVDFNTFMAVGEPQKVKEIDGALQCKLRLWKEITGSTPNLPPNLARFALLYLKEWKKLWHLGSWQKHSQKRKDLCSKLTEGSKFIRIAYEGMSLSPVFSDLRVDRMTRRYCSNERQPMPPNPRKRKERGSGTGKKEELAAFKLSRSWGMDALAAYRRRFNKGMRCYYYAMEGIQQSTHKKQLHMSEVEEMQDEIEVGLKAVQKMASDLRFNLQKYQEQEKNLKPATEAARLRKEMDVLKARVAADRKKMEEEKAQLEAARLTFNKEKDQVRAAGRAELACQKCRQRPYNVVIVPCLHGKFCSDCLLTHSKTSSTCPTCAGAIKGTFHYLV